MRHLVRDVSRVLTLFLASRQAWPKILGGKFRCLGGGTSPKRCLDKTLPANMLKLLIMVLNMTVLVLMLVGVLNECQLNDCR